MAVDMNAVGIVAEFNPFHNGHRYLIYEAKRRTGSDSAIVVMSASFVQRGEPACFDKYTRTRHALANGADIVIELPDIASVSCAESFANAAIGLLVSTGVVSSIAFGSECGDCERLNEASTAEIDAEALAKALADGLSYPAALSKAVTSFKDQAPGPNDILAIEYIKSLNKYNSNIPVFPIKRIGAGHDDVSIIGETASANAIRSAALEGNIGVIRDAVPPDVFGDIDKGMKSGSFPATLSALSAPILASLRSLGTHGIAMLADVSEGLENPIMNAALSCSSVYDLLSEVKTKRYTMARLKRIMISALLGTTKELAACAAEIASRYIHVLGVREDKKQLLKRLKENAAVPVVISSDDTALLSASALRIFEHTNRASLLRALACPKDKTAVNDLSHRLVTYP